MKAFIVKTSSGEYERILLVTPTYCAPLEKWFTETYTNKNFEDDGAIIDDFEKKFPAQFLEFIRGGTDFAVGTFEIKWSRQAIFL